MTDLNEVSQEERNMIEARREYQRKWRAENRDRVKEYNKKFYKRKKPDSISSNKIELIQFPAQNNNSEWYKKAPQLFNSICQCADYLNHTCGTYLVGNQIVEHQINEVHKSLYIEKLCGYFEAIETFTGIHYCFTQSDTYYGICDDNENFIYKVPIIPRVIK